MRLFELAAQILGAEPGCLVGVERTAGEDFEVGGLNPQKERVDLFGFSSGSSSCSARRIMLM